MEPEREVPAYIRQLLEEEPCAEGEGRSGQTFHLVLSGLEAGFSDEEILWLAEGHTPSTEKYGDDVDIEVERILDKHRGDHDHVGEDCLEADCESTPEWLRARRRLAVVRGFADAHHWSYPGGATDRLVLGHLLDVGERAGTATVSASVRDVATKVNRTKDTVSRSLRRLQGARGTTTRWIYLEVAGGGKDGGGRLDDASVYTVYARRRIGTLSHSPSPPSMELEGVSVLRSHDVWTHGALNQSGFEVYVALLRCGPISVPKLVAQFAGPPRRLSPDTVRRALGRLEEHRLAERWDGDLWSAVERNLDEVAWGVRVRGKAVRGRGRRRAYQYGREQKARQQTLLDHNLITPRKRPRRGSRKAGQ